MGKYITQYRETTTIPTKMTAIIIIRRKDNNIVLKIVDTTYLFNFLICSCSSTTLRAR